MRTRFILCRQSSRLLRVRSRSVLGPEGENPPHCYGCRRGWRRIDHPTRTGPRLPTLRPDRPQGWQRGGVAGSSRTGSSICVPAPSCASGRPARPDTRTATSTATATCTSTPSRMSPSIWTNSSGDEMTAFEARPEPRLGRWVLRQPDDRVRASDGTRGARSTPRVDSSPNGPAAPAGWQPRLTTRRGQCMLTSWRRRSR